MPPDATPDLFGFDDEPAPWLEALLPGAVVWRAGARSRDAALLAAVHEVTAQAPWRHLITPGGFRMSVAMTSCGDAGWVSDRRGYRYDTVDPDSGKPWPPIDRKSTRLNSSHLDLSRMPSSA